MLLRKVIFTFLALYKYNPPNWKGINVIFVIFLRLKIVLMSKKKKDDSKVSVTKSNVLYLIC